ncbi:MAG TPA: hypothetical protein VJM32_06530 [Candidatus Saccharimonadales bacterium]|nr:hypothetical protein [Candidatus Saccharimonadales bacterium]
MEPTTRRRALGLGGVALLGAAAAALTGEAAMAQPSDGRRGPEPSLVLPGLEVPPPWMALPFRKRDAARSGGTSNISEGTYLGSERGIHGGGHDIVAGIIGNGLHNAIDYDLPYDTDILAPADGVAFRTYQSWLTNVVYQRDGRSGRVGFGLGLWLITLHRVPGTNVYWWTKKAHCSWIDPGVRYLRPYVDADGDWHEPNSGPDNLYIPDGDLFAMGTPIKRGDVLARVGDTGVEWGWRDDFDIEAGQVRPRNRGQLPPWDVDIHLHDEIYRRVNGSPAAGESLDTRRLSIDPFGRYGQVRRWEGYSAYDGYKLSPGHVFLTDRGKPIYAA